MSFKEVSPISVARGGTGASTLAQHGVLLGQGTSAITSQTGTAGFVLTANSSADPTFQAVSLASVTGARVLITSIGVTGSPTAVSFTSGITGYTYYEIEVLNYLGDTTATDLTMQFSTNNGGAWQNTNYSFAGYTGTDAPTLTGVGGTSQASLPLALSLAVTASQFTTNGLIQFFNLGSSTQYKQVLVNMSFANNTPRLTNKQFAGAWNSTTVVNGIQIAISSGVMLQGTFRLFGIV